MGPAMLAYAGRCFMEGGEFGHTLCFLIILYLFVLFRFSFQNNRFITTVIALKFEKLELFEEVQNVNDRLRKEITERKAAQETLKESEEKFRLAFRTSPDPIVLNRLSDGMYLDVSDSFTKTMGYTLDEAIGKTTFELDIWHDLDDRERLAAGLRSAGFVENMEAKFRAKDGRILTGFISACLLSINKEKVSLTISRDITDLKKAEEEKEKLETQLFHAQKLESVGRLAGGVAHDFNNMLSVINGRSEMALESGILSDGLRHNVEEILRAGRRSADLVRQLLAFARKQTAAPEILDLNGTISGMLMMLRRLIGEDISLFWSPGPDLWKVKIDPSQVDQILANIAVNARDAISGAGSITISTDDVVIEDSVRAANPEFVPGDYVLLTVSDTGTGMSREVSEKIFEPFFTTKEVGRGTGLGLSMIYGIVKQNDGFIYVESEPGKGSTFKIYLPRCKAETAQLPPEEPASGRPTGTETVVLVEDDEAMLNISRTMLERLGYTVLAAPTPAEALRLVEKHPERPDLLMTDVVMPEMNGRELTGKIRTIRPGLKCLYMSGYTTDVISRQGILDEGVNFIQKPFAIDDLALKIRQVLDFSDAG
jgi:PAS domain S-box-containing protein